MANPTTNYGWPMPTTTDLVTDLPADFAAFGQPVDTTLKALNPETTLGDIAYRSATSNTNTRLGIGSAGQVLTVAGGVPTWAASAGGGKVLQVVNVVYGTFATTSSTTFADTGLTASITPSSASSKILVMVHQNGTMKDTSNLAGQLQLLRNSTVITYIGSRIGLNASSNQNGVGTVSTTYLDSPATTSSTTYKTQFAVSSAAAQLIFQGTFGGVASESTITLMEIGA